VESSRVLDRSVRLSNLPKFIAKALFNMLASRWDRLVVKKSFSAGDWVAFGFMDFPSFWTLSASVLRENRHFSGPYAVCGLFGCVFQERFNKIKAGWKGFKSGCALRVGPCSGSYWFVG
jgi:hypothetical protein